MIDNILKFYLIILLILFIIYLFFYSLIKYIFTAKINDHGGDFETLV
jgi:hypothetical protein